MNKLFVAAALCLALFLAGCLQGPGPGQQMSKEEMDAKMNELKAGLEDTMKSFNEAMVYYSERDYSAAEESFSEARMKLASTKPTLQLLQFPPEQEQVKTDLTAMFEIFDSAFQAFKKLSGLMGSLKQEVPGLKQYILLLNEFDEAIELLESAQARIPEIKSAEMKKDLDFSEPIASLKFGLRNLDSNEMHALLEFHSFMKNIDSEAVRDMTVDLTKGETDDTEKMSTLFSYVQENISYISDPRYNEIEYDYLQSPAKTLEREAGDCDDYAVLMASMLESVGIASAFCMADTNAFDDREFSHALAAAEIDGRWVYLEPGSKHIAAGECPWCEDEQTWADIKIKCLDYEEYKNQLENFQKGI